MMEYPSRDRESASLSLDTAHRILADEDRRAVVTLFLEARRPLTLSDLTRLYVNRHDGRSITEVPGDHVTELYARLLHHHVPFLATAGVVEYDNNRQLVTPTDRIECLEPLLEVR